MNYHLSQLHSYCSSSWVRLQYLLLYGKGKLISRILSCFGLFLLPLNKISVLSLCVLTTSLFHQHLVYYGLFIKLRTDTNNQIQFSIGMCARLVLASVMAYRQSHHTGKYDIHQQKLTWSAVSIIFSLIALKCSHEVCLPNFVGISNVSKQTCLISSESGFLTSLHFVHCYNIQFKKNILHKKPWKTKQKTTPLNVLPCICTPPHHKKAKTKS